MINHNAPIPYPTKHHYATEMNTCAHFCNKFMHCGIFVSCGVGFVRCAYCNLTIPFAVIMILIIQSGHKFAYVTKAELSWHVQIYDLFQLFVFFRVKAIWMLTRFGLRAHKPFVKWCPEHCKVQLTSTSDAPCWNTRVWKWRGKKTKMCTLIMNISFG